ncbi:MAG: hypothetical protein WDM80_16745 [Limisphaerales bacterium]
MPTTIASSGASSGRDALGNELGGIPAGMFTTGSGGGGGGGSGTNALTASSSAMPGSMSRLPLRPRH